MDLINLWQFINYSVICNCATPNCFYSLFGPLFSKLFLLVVAGHNVT